MVTGDRTESSGEYITLTIPETYIYLSVRAGIILPAQSPALTTTETYVKFYSILTLKISILFKFQPSL